MSGEENVLCQHPGGSTEEVWRPSLSSSDGEHVGTASQQATDQSTQARFPEPHTHAGLAGLRGNALLLGETRFFFLGTGQGCLNSPGPAESQRKRGQQVCRHFILRQQCLERKKERNHSLSHLSCAYV